MATVHVGGTLTFTFLCGLRGYHDRNPVVGECLPAQQESDKAHDRYAIAAFPGPFVHQLWANYPMNFPGIPTT